MLALNYGHRKLLTIVDSRVQRCVSGQSPRLSDRVLSLKWDFHVDPTTTTTTKAQGTSWKRGKKNVKAGGFAVVLWRFSTGHSMAITIMDSQPLCLPAQDL